MMKEIVLIGGGGHCKSVIDVIEQEGQFQIVGIIDKVELFGTDVLGYPVIGSDLDLESLAKKHSYALVTIGQIKSPKPRVRLFDLAKKAHIRYLNKIEDIKIELNSNILIKVLEKYIFIDNKNSKISLIDKNTIRSMNNYVLYMLNPKLLKKY